MRILSNTEINRIKALTERAIELTLIEPTETGLEKSIMDATGPVRSYLKEKSLHDYGLQTQGPEHKIIIDAQIITHDKVVDTKASLYRPITKKGDPRIWFKKLGCYTSPNDILGLIAYKHKLYVVNITTLDIISLLSQSVANPLKEIIAELSYDANMVANELLGLIRNIARKGPIPALLNADTAVGRTLEHALGIQINSSKNPDYKGIELKSFRSERPNRKNLFAQVPNWTLSKFKSSAEILDAFGYSRQGDFKLYCTVSTLVRNSQGLQFKLDTNLAHLVENSEDKTIGNFVLWTLETLHSRLLEKHNETFWVEAESIMLDGHEHFLYKKVQHTRKPIISQFDILLEQGLITMDHLIKKHGVTGKVVEKGPLFKIKPKAIDLLFPPSQLYIL